MPTETVYGLAADATNERAVLNIFKIKDRPSFDPLIAHFAHLDHVREFVETIPENLNRLLEQHWPGPLTMLLKKNDRIPEVVTSGLSTVAIRIPNHPMALKLLSGLDFPLAAPSANPFGYVSPTSANHVNDQLGERIPYILDGGPSQIGVESTILGFDENGPVVYRLGGTKVETIEETLGPVKMALNQSSNPIAPGMLKSHYAPKRKVYIGEIEALIDEHKGKKIGVISFFSRHQAVPEAHQIILSPKANLDEAASRLFSALRLMDKLDLDLVLTERFPETGLGRAINDRLKRAAV